ncbi:MAG: hydroxymethylglutaryl-CoA lyase [candidate division WOR-3 bacterium]
MKIYITEVGPRDGLQNIKEIISTEKKIEFINKLSESGVDEIEVSSFVSPKAIPQLSDAEEVFRNINRNKNVIYSALVPNEKGLERALSVNVDKISVFTSASETFNLKNINMTIEESLNKFKNIIKISKEHKKLTRAYISTAFYCPYEGKIEEKKVFQIALKLLEFGVDEISIGDTIGKASPDDVRNLLSVLLKEISIEKIVLHFHVTYGMAMANVYVAYKEFSIYKFDSSAGGLGGCPFAVGARGNIATEDLVYMLKRIGANVNVDILKIVSALDILGIESQSYISKVINLL